MCRRTFCPDCGEEMIHRDNRHHYEASSALNQIIHREGPRELTVGDIDTYSIKRIGNRMSLRIIEHKQPRQAVKDMQRLALGVIDECIRHAAAHSLFGLMPDSGVFVMRGRMRAGSHGRQKVDFAGHQTIETLRGATVIKPPARADFWNWLCCGTPWTKRNEKW